MSETKICSTCKLTKSLDQFNRKSSNKDGLEKYCKECHRARNKRHYEARKDVYIATSRKNRKKMDQWWFELKSQYTCSSCSEDRPWCIDFHHVDRKDKHTEVSTLRAWGNKQAVLNEIEKCIPLCRNCHADLHYREQLQIT